MVAGAVSLDLCGPRELRFDHNAIADLDMALYRDAGVTLFEVFEKVDEDNPPVLMMGPGGARLLLWAGLKWSDKKLTPQKAYALLMKSGKSLLDIVPPVWKALSECELFTKLPGDEDAPEAAPGKPEAPATTSP